MTNQSNPHRPVMLAEVLELLHVQPQQWYLDATFGGGGHTQAILAKEGRVLGLDWDETAVASGKDTFVDAIQSGNLILERSSFAQLDSVVDKYQQQIYPGFRGALFDFGTSSSQLMDSSRGFSFNGEGPLDMRMDARQGVTAADLIAFASEKELARILFEYGGETQARAVAKAIKHSPVPVTTTSQLTELVLQAKGRQRDHLHPATKTFQALRIAVNTELENIAHALPLALSVLQPEGRLVTISFHEGEDRLPKQLFRQWSEQEKVKLLTKKPIHPDQAEVASNPRARSASLRAVEKV